MQLRAGSSGPQVAYQLTASAVAFGTVNASTTKSVLTAAIPGLALGSLVQFAPEAALPAGITPGSAIVAESGSGFGISFTLANSTTAPVVVGNITFDCLVWNTAVLAP